MANCKICNKVLTGNKQLVCSNECRSNYNYIEYIKRWKLGKETGSFSNGRYHKYIKRYLFAKFGSKCTRCGWSGRNEVTGNIMLEVEHLDGNQFNNIETNLDLICPNCHSLTSTFRGANIKNKAKFREEFNKNSSVIKQFNKPDRYCLICNSLITNQNDEFCSFDCKVNYERNKIIDNAIYNNCLTCDSKLDNLKGQTKYCSHSCSTQGQFKFKATKEELFDKILELKNWAAVGRFYGVSSDSILRRCKYFGLPHHIGYYKNL